MLNTIKEVLNTLTNTNNLANKEPLSYNCDANVGGTILKHYQDQWADLHEISEANAQMVTQMAETIEVINTDVEKKQESAKQIINFLSSNFQSSIDNCVIQLKQLRFLFDETEKSLANLEDVIESIELHNQMKQQENELAQYKQLKLAHLEQYRLKLEEKHTKQMTEHELKEKRIMQERQQAFQEAFEDDLNTYKQTGSIPKIQVPSSPSVLLEEVQLECNDEELDKFLN